MKAKQLEEEIHDQVNANITLFNYNTCPKSVLPSSWFNVLRTNGISESAWDEDNFSPPELQQMCETKCLKDLKELR
jgi:hypothetical protein